MNSGARCFPVSWGLAGTRRGPKARGCWGPAALGCEGEGQCAVSGFAGALGCSTFPWVSWGLGGLLGKTSREGPPTQGDPLPDRGDPMKLCSACSSVQWDVFTKVHSGPHGGSQSKQKVSFISCLLTPRSKNTRPVSASLPLSPCSSAPPMPCQLYILERDHSGWLRTSGGSSSFTVHP